MNIPFVWRCASAGGASALGLRQRGGSQLPVLAGYAFRYLGDCLQRRGSAGDAHRSVPGWGDPAGRWSRICRWRCVRKPSTAIWRISNGWSAAITTPARFSAPGGDGAHYRPALRAGRPAAGDGEAGPPAGDPVAQPFIGNRRLSRRRAAEIRHDAGSILRGTRLAGK